MTSTMCGTCMYAFLCLVIVNCLAFELLVVRQNKMTIRSSGNCDIGHVSLFADIDQMTDRSITKINQ